MKKYLYLVTLLLLIGQSLVAQTKKVYLTKSGSYTSNSKKAVSYVLVQNLGGDSAYMASLYDINNNLTAKGTYKDESLTIPTGKFVYYKNTPNGNYKSAVGYFLNGRRIGSWYDYSPDGQVIAEYNYENNTLNGVYKVYNPDVNTRGEGTTVNGLLQGDFKWYNGDNLLISESTYKNGKVTDQTTYLKAPKARFDIYSYINNSLAKSHIKLKPGQLTIKYVVNKDGKIEDPQIVSTLSADVNAKISSVLNNLVAYKPALYNNVPVVQNVSQIFNISSTGDVASVPPNGPDPFRQLAQEQFGQTQTAISRSM